MATDPHLTRRTLLLTGAAGAAAAAVPAQAHADGGGPSATADQTEAQAIADQAEPMSNAERRRCKRWVESTIAAMSRAQKIGQLFVQEVYGADPAVADQRNVPRYGVATPAEVVQRWHLGGAIYFAWTDSFKSPAQVAGLSNGLQRAALAVGQVPLSISTDQEQGVVTRFGLPATQFPGSMALGAGRRSMDAWQAASITGQELRAVGINVNFAPVSDVNLNAKNPVIGVRSFSSDPHLVATMTSAQVQGYQRQGRVSSCTKHFPGHGDTATDSHTGLPVITHTREQWLASDVPPFRAAIKAGVDMVMTAHLVMPALDDSGDPATLSKTIITDLLRGELGYSGVVITDGLMMDGVRTRYGDAEVAVRALEAGVDQLLMCPDLPAAWAAIESALDSGRLSAADVDDKLRRILTAKYRRGFVAKPYCDPDRIDAVVGTARHRRTADRIAERTVTLVKNDARALPMRPKRRRILVTGFGATTTADVGAQLSKRGAIVDVRPTGTSPTDEVIAEQVRAAAEADYVLVLTNKAWDTAITDRTGGQTKLVQALLKTSATVIVVAVRDPYDINRFPDAPTYVASYSYSPVAPAALVRVLTGEVRPTGKLPVDIPTADDSGSLLFRYGHGLRY